MNDVPEVKLSGKPEASWGKKVNKAIRGNTLVHSPDFILKQSPAGTSIKLNPKHKQILGILQYTGSSFDISQSYDPNTMIRVTDNTAGAVPGTYIANRPIPSLYYYAACVAGGISLSGSDFAIYVRDASVNYVPGGTANTGSKAWDSIGGGGTFTIIDFDQDAAIPANTCIRVDFNASYRVSFTASSGQTFPPLNAGIFITQFDVPDSASRNSGNYYYPFYPYWTGSHEVTVSGSTYNRLYFKEIKPYNMVSGCENNRTVTTFSDTWKSGSGFAYQLPHTG